jgi:hypothetical protein
MDRRALLVGINRYAVPGSDLKGCVNDARLMASTLATRYGFPPEGTTLLLDGEATGAAIRRELARLVDGASRGDSLVFHYSGHGSQLPDREGDERDGKDEILCPHDMDWDHPFTDDELGRYCDALPEGALLTVILDCCHSGTGLRDGDAAAAASARFLPRPAGGGSRPSGSPRRRGPRTVPAAGNAVLVSGCRDDQSSADALIDGTWHGALTYHLHRSLERGGWKVPLRKLVADTALSLRRGRFDQEPQLEGPPRLLDGWAFLNPKSGGMDEFVAA